MGGEYVKVEVFESGKNWIKILEKEFEIGVEKKEENGVKEMDEDRKEENFSKDDINIDMEEKRRLMMIKKLRKIKKRN